MWGTLADPKLQLRMRIKKLNSEGFGDENGMVRALKYALSQMEKKADV